jgi:predicted ribosome quality control (RQC) complex YloA/Tae2 family protein
MYAAKQGARFFFGPQMGPTEDDPLNDAPENQAVRADGPKVWAYQLPGGHQVLAGKTDADNDRLSLTVAGPGDWWFHVRGMSGSHVVLIAAPGRPPDRQILNQAAAIAAYHSKARKGGVVSVSGTLARYVTKPRGAKPGSVQIRKERIFKVRPALPEAYRQGCLSA